MTQRPELLLIGDGRLARHLAHYFMQLGVRHASWSRGGHSDGRCPELAAMVHPGTRALLAISDSAIEPFIEANPRLQRVPRVHFSGRLTSTRATAAHPLFSFAATFYDRDTYERIPFVLDRGSPPLTSVIPGLHNPSFFIDPGQRSRYHALVVLAGNFATLLWRKLFFELERELGLARAHALPYLESVVRGLAGDGAPLSGPLSRGDHDTIRRNLEALKGDPFEAVYRAFVSAYEEQQALGRIRGGQSWLTP